ncbi:NusG domain II-containing protein [uncultured Robinsoniella sp.]|uniref:NusG domain II-containing protein n=1 Tax=uncultured Robinsoniella sp. TaxID=904190 RepID=UPI00374E3004
MKKNDWILAGAVIAVALIAFVGYTFFQKDGNKVQIMTDGKEFGVYSLSKDQVIDINGTNTLEIKDGKADMISAECPDKLCVHQKAISKSGESIICLPYKIVVRVEGAKEASDYDSIAG